ncbi:MAG: hypothetical protein Q9182_003087 [Xanthomendoza sp. 2 TL-2023]
MDIKYIDGSTISFKGWHLTGCVNHRVRGPRLNQLLGFLHQLNPHIEAVIADAQKGLRSTHGYTTFFKTAINVRKVVAKYRPLLDASPIILSEARSKILGNMTAQPKFRCINEDNPKHAAVMALCNRPLGYDISPRQPLLAHPGSEYLDVCPSFFQMDQYPLPGRNCPILWSDGRFRKGDVMLLSSGFAFMVYALVMMYNRELHETYSNYQMIYDMRYAEELNGRHSVLNAESYGLYAGGSCGDSFGESITQSRVLTRDVAIQGNCTDFSRARGRHDGEFDLR